MFKGLLYLAILTATVVASWIGLSVYHEFTASTISSKEAIIITPIPSSFDRGTIETIKAKKIIKVDLSAQIEEVNQVSESTGSAQTATGSAQQEL